MRYNLEIRNIGVLPIPYIDRCGEQVAVANLFKDKPIYRDALFIGATHNRQILIHSTTVDTIIEPSPDLEIVFKSDSGEVA